MSTPTLVGAIRSGHRYTARYLDWGIEPDMMLRVLRLIWTDTFARDTVGMLNALLANDWTALGTTSAPYHGDEPVPGVGLRQPTGLGLRHGAVTDDVDGWLEWMYLIDARIDDVAAYEATCHGRWLLHSRHPLHPPAVPQPTATDGEYSPLAHRWTPATITLPDNAGTFTADICVAHHPRSMTVARISDDVATAIVHAGTTIASSGATLHQNGSAFDLSWPSGAPLQAPIRLPRDEDGLLVVATPWWPWPPTQNPESR
jgi:hypothetical protein